VAADIYLASASPRRRELLLQIGVAFELLAARKPPREPAAVDESVLPGEKPDDYVRRVTQHKAEVAWQRLMLRTSLARLPVLAADTTVALGPDILGKPATPQEARAMLERLSGTTHRVLTAVALVLGDRRAMRVSDTRVTFCRLDEARIHRYVETGEPFDKAGGYGIQGPAGAFVMRIEGSYTGVVGLPLFETVELLREFGVSVA
jgi:septum formation protein